jgi:hypothetical protein
MLGVKKYKYYFEKKGVPKPKNNSLKKKPAKILPKPNKNNGINIFNDGS